MDQLSQLMNIKGEEEKPEDNEWLHICSCWGDKEEPERQTHELFSIGESAESSVSL